MKKRIFSIAAASSLCVLCGFLSGCGCSKEPDVRESDVPRMEDPVYTNALVSLRDAKASLAGKAEVIRAKIAKLGEGAKDTAEYAQLTNELARCAAEADKVRKEALQTVRARILKENAAKKGGLK